MTAIWGTGHGGRWQLLAPSQYPAEAALHDLVAEAPQILPLAGAPRITVLGREVRLGNGYADLIAVESSGRLVVIEVKLATNAEARRAVVAQVLSYAAYLQGLDPAQLETQVLAGHLTNGGYDSVLAAVKGDDQDHSLDPDAFTAALAASLADGGFRVVIVLDSAPDELVQLVGYLESLTDQIVIDLITVRAYEVNGAQVLVPQRVEPARRTRELSDSEVISRQAGSLQPGSADFRAAIAQAPANQQPTLNRLTDWAEQLQNEGLVALATYHGKTGMSTLLPRLPSGVGLVTIYHDSKSTYLQFWRSVFTRLAPDAIPTIEALIGTPLKQGNTTHTIPDELLDALTDAYRQAAHAPTHTEPTTTDIRT